MYGLHVLCVCMHDWRVFSVCPCTTCICFVRVVVGAGSALCVSLHYLDILYVWLCVRWVRSMWVTLCTKYSTSVYEECQED